jgi:hypothetical protein
VPAWYPSSRRVRRIVASSIAGAVVLGSGSALLAFSAGNSAAASPSTPTTGYSVFGQPPSPADAIPTGFAADQAAGTEVRSQPTSVLGLLVWAVAREDQLCVAEADLGGGSEACAPAASIAAGSNSLLYSATAEGTASTDVGAVDLIVGLAPDGASGLTFQFSDGTSATVPIVDNGFQLSTPGLVKIASVSWQDASGASHVETLGAPS